MNYWQMLTGPGSSLYLTREDLYPKLGEKGINPKHVRSVLEVDSVNTPLIFSLILDERGTRPRLGDVIPDYLIWGWIPVFSGPARLLIIECGGLGSDFVQCSLDTHPGQEFFMHLPVDEYDVVDIARSEFSMLIPFGSDLVVPHGIKALTVKQGIEYSTLPPCFRASIPRADQVFSELIATDVLEMGWRNSSLSEVQFKKLGSQLFQ